MTNSSAPNPNGCSVPVKHRVNRNGINSGIGSISVAEPNAWPKSIEINSPDFLSTRKFSMCRSPMPRTYPDILMTAKLWIKPFRMYRNASGDDAIRSKYWRNESFSMLLMILSNRSTISFLGLSMVLIYSIEAKSIIRTMDKRESACYLLLASGGE